MKNEYEFERGDVVTYQRVEHITNGRIPINRTPQLLGVIVDVYKKRNGLKGLFKANTIIEIKRKDAFWDEPNDVINLDRGDYHVSLYDSDEGIMAIMQEQKRLALAEMKNAVTIGDRVIVDMWRNYRLNERWEGEVVGIYEEKSDCRIEGSLKVMSKLLIKFDDTKELYLPSPMRISIDSMTKIIEGVNWTDENKKMFENVINRY